MPNFSSTIVKTYPVRGPLSQYRLEKAIAFHCFRCGSTKTAKLITLYNGDVSKTLCNGCYGRLLSIYDIKANSDSEAEKAELLGDLLLKTASADELKEAERLLNLRDEKSKYLSPLAIKFLATSEFLASALANEESLEWSPVVIGLCKAAEFEIVEKVVAPLSKACKNIDIEVDIADKDIGRVASYCANPSAKKPPELGSFAHFLQTTIFSESRKQTSPTIKAFYKLCENWVGATWILNRNGLHPLLMRITGEFRNPAAHTTELSQTDYKKCFDLINGPQGLLWQLIRSTESAKKASSEMM